MNVLKLKGELDGKGFKNLPVISDHKNLPVISDHK